MNRARSRQRSPSFHVTLEGRDHAIERIRPSLLFGLAFGQRFRNARKPDKPPTIVLSFQCVSISKRHDYCSKSASGRPERSSVAPSRASSFDARSLTAHSIEATMIAGQMEGLRVMAWLYCRNGRGRPPLRSDQPTCSTCGKRPRLSSAGRKLVLVSARIVGRQRCRDGIPSWRRRWLGGIRRYGYRARRFDGSFDPLCTGWLGAAADVFRRESPRMRLFSPPHSVGED